MPRMVVIASWTPGCPGRYFWLAMHLHSDAYVSHHQMHLRRRGSRTIARWSRALGSNNREITRALPWSVGLSSWTPGRLGCHLQMTMHLRLHVRQSLTYTHTKHTSVMSNAPSRWIVDQRMGVGAHNSKKQAYNTVALRASTHFPRSTKNNLHHHFAFSEPI